MILFNESVTVDEKITKVNYKLQNLLAVVDDVKVEVNKIKRMSFIA